MTTRRNFTSGQGAAERSDSSSAVGGPDWIQPGFIAPEHVHVTLQWLWDAHNGQARYQLEVTNPVTKELIALRSRPFHRDEHGPEVSLGAAWGWLLAALDQLGVMDPF